MQQIASCPYLHSGNFTHAKIEHLAAILLQEMQHPSFDNGAVMFLNSGAEAIEAACKLAIQYFAERKWGTPYLYGREHSYHGNTLFTLALGDHPRRHSWTVYLPQGSVRRLHLRDPHSNVVPPDDDFGALERLGESGIPFVVVVEPVAGTTAGIILPRTQYLAHLRKVCDRYKALLIYDEVLCGQYRFGEMFAHRSDHMAGERAPDICCIGKGLTGGYFPLSAVIVSGKVMEALHEGSGRLWHSTTNQNHPLGCAAGVTAMQEYRDLEGRRAILRQALYREVEKFCDCDAVASVGGGELLYGIRLHSDHPQDNIRRRCLEHQVALYGDSTHNMLLLAPPYCMENYELEEACEIVRKVINGPVG